MTLPSGFLGLHHVALYIQDLEKSKKFYVDILGMKIEWQPDEENIYLTSGSDNLALHQAKHPFAPRQQQRLDHMGFIMESPDAVTAWHDYLKAHAVNIVQGVKHHRDGAVSFYCLDPDGNTVQFIFHPPLSRQR